MLVCRWWPPKMREEEEEKEGRKEDKGDAYNGETKKYPK